MKNKGSELSRTRHIDQFSADPVSAVTMLISRSQLWKLNLWKISYLLKARKQQTRNESQGWLTPQPAPSV